MIKRIIAVGLSLLLLFSVIPVMAAEVSGEELYKEAVTALTAGDTEEGLTLMEQAYEAGYEQAAKELADICFNNRKQYLEEPDYDRALTYCLIAAEMGDDMCYINAGQIYLYGYGSTEEDPEKALECFLKAVSSENQQAQMKSPRWVGLAYEKMGDYENAFTYYTEAYEKGDISGSIFLALMYLHGNAVEQDVEKALTMLEEVLEKNSSNQKAGDAAIELGRIYETGDEVETDPEAAQAWYEKGAAMGNADAQAELERFLSEQAAGTETEQTEGQELKYTEQVTEDGWVLVENADGAALGYSPESGVGLLEADGYAFKDLNKNGVLDPYEDWRLDVDTRAEDLASQLPLDFMFGLMHHGDLSGVEKDGSEAYSRDPEATFSELMDKGMRSALNRAAGSTPSVVATWNNNAQAYAEAAPYGIPANISANPSFESAQALALAATFDPQLVNEDFKIAAAKYRAIGVTTLLGPQADLATEPRWNRITGTFGEDPMLAKMMVNAAISALQSTYDEEGNDLGWGEDSVVAMMKHFPGDGSGECGRESHSESGKYTVYPGDGFETALIPFVEGAMSLDSATECASAVMTSYSIAYDEDEAYGELVGSAFSKFKIDILREDYDYDGVICSDWFVLNDIGQGNIWTPWGMEDAPVEERLAAMILAGMDQVGGNNEAPFEEAYAIVVEELGEEAAQARIRESARRIVKTYFQANLFENPYVYTKNATELFDGADAVTHQKEVAQKTVVMLKNTNDAIKPSDGEKHTVYVPMTFSNNKWVLPVDLAELNQYYDVVTDTVGEPTGKENAKGVKAYTEDDIIRATAEELAACESAIVIVNSPLNKGSEAKGYGHDNNTDTYYPIALQYGEYVADGENVRTESISGNLQESEIDSPYGAITQLEKQNRSYYGASSIILNTYELDAILHAVDTMPEEADVIVCMNATNPVIFSEFEEKVDAILIGFSVDKNVFLDITSGQTEPSGLLPLQMPADMDTVEAQLEDVPRDMECYTDSEGNVYDFAFGMNWTGVIQDERVSTYTVEPQLTLQNAQ